METAFARFLVAPACALALLAVPASAAGPGFGHMPAAHPGGSWHHGGGHGRLPGGYSPVIVVDPYLTRSYSPPEPVAQPVYVPVFYPVPVFQPVQPPASSGYRWQRPLALPAGPKIIEIEPTHRAVYLSKYRVAVAGGHRPRWQHGLKAASAHIYWLD